MNNCEGVRDGTFKSRVGPTDFKMSCLMVPIVLFILVLVFMDFVSSNYPNCPLVVAYVGLQLPGYVLMVMMLFVNYDKNYNNSSLSGFIAVMGEHVGYFVSHNITFHMTLKLFMTVYLRVRDRELVMLAMIVGMVCFELLIFFPLSEAANGHLNELTRDVEGKKRSIFYRNIHPDFVTAMHYIFVVIGFFFMASSLLCLKWNSKHLWMVEILLAISSACGAIFLCVKLNPLCSYSFEILAIGLLFITVDFVLVFQALGIKFDDWWDAMVADHQSGEMYKVKCWTTLLSNFVALFFFLVLFYVLQMHGIKKVDFTIDKPPCEHADNKQVDATADASPQSVAFQAISPLPDSTDVNRVGAMGDAEDINSHLKEE